MEFRVDGGEFTTGSSIMPQKKNPDIAKLIRGRTGTELADYLVRKGMPFRKAHGVAGEIVRECVASGFSLRDLPLERYRKFAGEFRADVYGVLDPHASVARKHSAGSTSPNEVEKALRRWEQKLF